MIFPIPTSLIGFRGFFSFRYIQYIFHSVHTIKIIVVRREVCVLVVSLKAGGSSDPAAVQSLLPTDTPQHTVTGLQLHPSIFKGASFKVISWWARLQCSGSGSTCFWASRIRIHYPEVWIRLRIRILLSSSKNSKKNLDSHCFVTSFGLLSLKNDVYVPSKSNKQKNIF
jgi:hypothetical protein